MTTADLPILAPPPATHSSRTNTPRHRADTGPLDAAKAAARAYRRTARKARRAAMAPFTTGSAA